MPLVTMDDDVRIHVEDIGTGPAVVLISGFGLDHQLWDRQMRVLAREGYRVIAITQRGHGKSDHPYDAYSMDRLAADVVAVLESLGVSGVTLVGHSFGGQVSFHVTATAPNLVSKLVLVGSNAVRSSRSDNYPFGHPPEPVLAKLIDDEENNRIDSRYHLIGSTFGSEPSQRVVEWLMRTWMEMPSWAAVSCYTTMQHADLIHEMAAVKQPVLLISGTADPIHSARATRWVQSELANAQVAEMACGHFPMLEDPLGFEEILRTFITRAED